MSKTRPRWIVSAPPILAAMFACVCTAGADEVDYERYAAFLSRWKADAANAGSKKEAQDLAAAFQAETAKVSADWQAKIGSKDLVKQMAAAIATPDRIALEFSEPGWAEVTPANYDPRAAIYKYTKGEESFTLPFLALDDHFAMAAWETPLKLARLSGVPAGPTGEGPQIRRANTFLPAPEWLWKGPMDLEASRLGVRYFAPGVLPGDAGSDYCPVSWLTFPDASAMAEKLGGLVPTAAQWKSAVPRAGKERRLRSAGAWSKQSALLARWGQEFRISQAVSSPDVGSFSKTTDLFGNGDRAYLSDTSASQMATNDGKLWLTYTPEPQWKPASGFTHLIGNAAEWVNDNGTPAVMGGSVVSPPSLPMDRPIPVKERGGSYCDVTFRLVVKLAAGAQGAGLRKFKEAADAIPMPKPPAVK